MNPSTRNKRRFKVHMVSQTSGGATVLEMRIIEEAKDLDDLEHKLMDYCNRKHLFVRDIEEIDDQ